MNDLYRHERRLWMNVFQPSVMLVRRVRVGMRLRRVYEAAQTQRGNRRGTEPCSTGTIAQASAGRSSCCSC